MRKKTIFQSLAVCAVLALAFKLLAGHSMAQTAPQNTSTDASYEEFDAFIAQEVQRLNIPGLSLVIVEDGEIVHLQGFGQARPSGEAPTPQTPFFIGSLTKSFTALAVMQLVEEGKVDLDASVQEYLPWFQLADPAAAAQITVRNLLNQDSGISQMPGMINLVNFDTSPDAIEKHVRSLATLELARPVGSEFEYSNVNYNILGLIVAAVSGETYADYIQNHIFDPLAMSHSYTAQDAAKQDNLAVGHRFWFGIPFATSDLPQPEGSLPASGLIASAEDMGHYLIAHLNGGQYGDTQVLSAEGMEELHRPAVAAGAMGISMGEYGMGWFVEERGGTTIVSHTGTMPDFFDFMALLPEQNKGMALLINANHTMQDKMQLSELGIIAAQHLAGDTTVPGTSNVTVWVLRALLLVPVLQIVGLILTLRQLGRWRQEPDRRPTGARKWALAIILPLILHVILIGLALALVGSGLLGFMLLFVPDISWLALICGGFSLVWGILRTGLVSRALNEPAV